MARWLLFIYQLPQRPSAPRVAVWRALRRLPGGYARDGVYAVRFSPLHHAELENLAHDVHNYGGTASIVESARVEGEDLLSAASQAAGGHHGTAGGKRRRKRLPRL